MNFANVDNENKVPEIFLDPDQPLKILTLEEYETKYGKLSLNLPNANINDEIHDRTRSRKAKLQSSYRSGPTDIRNYKRYNTTFEEHYEMDEMDEEWLNTTAKKEKQKRKFEFLMCLFEKESYFLIKRNTFNQQEEKKFCCVCRDENSATLLSCEMCKILVHSRCYGVVYNPKGTWFCRRCLWSPSTPVNCIFCPNKNGAFIKTDTNEWCHVVCAYWIPEVYFENSILLEKVLNVMSIPAYRTSLTCYICRYHGKKHGACLQCDRKKCTKAYHASCANEAGFRLVSTTDVAGQICRFTYCHVHAASDDDARLSMKNDIELAHEKLKEYRNIIPFTATPMIPAERIRAMTSLVFGENYVNCNSDFVIDLIDYWTLKRKDRDGVPLLNPFQTSYAIQENAESQDDAENRIDKKAELAHHQQKNKNAVVSGKRTPKRRTTLRCRSSTLNQLRNCKNMRKRKASSGNKILADVKQLGSHKNKKRRSEQSPENKTRSSSRLAQQGSSTKKI